MPISFSSPSSRDARARGAGVTAVLGPTNTGKTHLAIERMLGHSSGIIGLPLRLLAREVYNKVVARVGADAVALITGEEKIKPANPRYWVATVEAMPRDLDVAFLAIDEIQLGADLERGHVFTDRILNRRAREETLVLGAATMRPMVERLLPGAHIVSRPRLSQLAFAGEKKLTRLPRRSAVVAFSAEEVYAIAELIRRQRGGAAVVLGALSPRTRNAQVALYQSGEVDYLVATDAIGMGLNLDVDHVAFASDRKFDGYQFRRLNPAELAQIAGRAGRATRDGTFGTTGRCPPFEDELVQQLETHSFEPVKVLQWRNTALDFSSLGALQASLAEVPSEPGLTRAPVADDILVLDHAARDEEVRALVGTPEAVARLWEVCQIPDYRKIAPATHAELVITLYGFLARAGRIPTDWFARQVDLADRTDGDIDTLSARIAQIRTWTFAANRPDWVEDPEHWQGVTRAVEDKLSDALHERLTERFVDRRTSVLMRRLREDAMPEAQIGKTGEVAVEGHVLGRLDGFTFAADPAAGGSEAKALHAAAQKLLAGEIDSRAKRLCEAPHDQFVLASDGVVRWLGAPVGRLHAGEDVLRPRLRVLADEQLTGPAREAVQARLDLWLKTQIERQLGPLFSLLAAEEVTGIARGVAFQLVEALGVIERQRIAEEVKGLDQTARGILRKHGVRFGAYHIYLPALLKPSIRALAAQLHLLKHGDSGAEGLDALQQAAGSGRTSFPADPALPKLLYRLYGYRVCGPRAVRVDILERLADMIRAALAWRPGAAGAKPPGALDGSGFVIAGPMTSLIGASSEDLAQVLHALGYCMEKRPKPDEPDQAAAAPALSADATLQPAADAGLAALPGDTGDPAPSPDVAGDESAPASVPQPAAAEAEAAPAAAVEPVLIEVWRPGRRPEEARSARSHRRAKGRRGSKQPSAEAVPAVDKAIAAASAAGPTTVGDGDAARAPRDAHRQPAGRGAKGEQETRSAQVRSRPERGEGRERNHQPARTHGRPRPVERREKRPDPDSPFAKLAALKEQLEAAAKERR